MKQNNFCLVSSDISLSIFLEAGQFLGFIMQLFFSEGFGLQPPWGPRDDISGFLHSFVTGDFAKLHINFLIGYSKNVAHRANHS